MLIFFDGEEAFGEWGPNDSIYGAKHLASEWHNIKITYDKGNLISELDKMVKNTFIKLLINNHIVIINNPKIA